VHIKDLYAMRLKARAAADLLPVTRKLIYVPASAKLERLLQLFVPYKVSQEDLSGLMFQVLGQSCTTEDWSYWGIKLPFQDNSGQ
jgi:hypothetical protein